MRDRWHAGRSPALRQWTTAGAMLAAVLITAHGLSAGGPAPRGTAVVVDDFESGKLNGWDTKISLRGTWVVYTAGSGAPDPTQSDARVPFKMPDPPQGKFAAVTDTNGPGTRILYKDVKIDGRYTLHLTVFYMTAGMLTSPETLDHAAGPNQQYRVDLQDPSAPVDSLAKSDVLATIFQTTPDGEKTLAPKAVSFDLSPWQGRTVRLRLACVDNRGPLRAGVDDIRLEPLGQ